MNNQAIDLFLVAATGLLGSPGPAIAALLAVGKAHGVAGGLRYYAGLQVGLALAAAVSVAGLVSLLAAIPLASHAMALAATAYLIYLAWMIASSPVGEAADEKRPVRSSPAAGFALGVMNPKAYVAFASLVASYTLVAGDARADGLLKWLLVVLVMLVVDLGWLLAGIALGWAKLAPRTERVLNLFLAAMILAAAMLALI